MKKRRVLLRVDPFPAPSKLLGLFCRLLKSLIGKISLRRALSGSAGLGFVILLLPASGMSFVQADLDRLFSTNECMKCDLTKADLSEKILAKAKLDGANLSGANLTNTILRMADLSDTNFSKANLTFTVFEAADLYKANFDGANLEGTIFDGAYLVGAVFGGEKNLKDQDKRILTGAAAEASPQKTEEQELISTEGPSKEAAQVGFEQPKQLEPPEPPKVQKPQAPVVKTIDPAQSIKALTQVPGGVDPGKYAPNPTLNITGFKPLPEDTKSSAYLEKAILPLSREDLLDKIGDTEMCVDCDFSGMDLADVKFKGIYLEGVTFEGANLEGANLRSANLKGANLRKANLKGADLREADLYKADLTGADLSGADLRDTLVVGAILTGANLEGTVLSQSQSGQ